MTEKNDGNSEKSTLRRLLSISLGVVGALFGVICALIAMMWGSLADGQKRNADAISANVGGITENRERIVRLETISELRSLGLLKEE